MRKGIIDNEGFGLRAEGLSRAVFQVLTDVGVKVETITLVGRSSKIIRKWKNIKSFHGQRNLTENTSETFDSWSTINLHLFYFFIFYLLLLIDFDTYGF